MQNVVKITPASLNYLVLVTSQNAPETANWLARVRDGVAPLGPSDLYIGLNNSMHQSYNECPWITMDEAFVLNHPDQYTIAPYIY